MRLPVLICGSGSVHAFIGYAIADINGGLMSVHVYIGFAIADDNYGGSTGYGREYRNRLRGKWGIVD